MFRMNTAQRRTSHLQYGRESIPGACYFVTCCTQSRRSGLDQQLVARELIVEWTKLHESGDAQLLCATTMPDHVHWLFVLGLRLTVGQVVGKWKTKTKPALQTAGLSWQANFFEHQLRDERKTEDFAFYVFMNPYAAGWCALDRAWPWWLRQANYRFRFEDLLGQGDLPQPEWLAKAERLRETLATGE